MSWQGEEHGKPTCVYTSDEALEKLLSFFVEGEDKYVRDQKTNFETVFRGKKNL